MLQTSVQQSRGAYDAVLLIGDRGASHRVYGRNKAFLEIRGIPLFIYVLEALQRAELINRICIVGPTEQIAQMLANHQTVPAPHNNLLLCQQGESLMHNAWSGFLHICPEAQTESPLPSAVSEKAILYISGDIPLVTPFEIDTFLRLADPVRYDYCLGMSSAEHLSFFRPRRGKPGIRTHFFHIKEGIFRQNNLHLVKPLRIAHRTYIQKVYDFRYQRDLRNIVRLAQEFIRVHVGWQGLWCYGLLHWNQLLARTGLSPLTTPTRALLPLSLIETCASRVLGTRFAVTLTPLAGAVLDIDNEKDYNAMRAMLPAWQQYLAEREKDLKDRQHGRGSGIKTVTRVA